MTSNRPYLIRAMYDWISDNSLTPYLLVDARMQGVRVPAGSVKDGQIVLNIAGRAVAQLELGNERIRFFARFSGVSQEVEVPVQAVLAVYAQENGQGMMFPAEPAGKPPSEPDPEPAPRKGPQLRVVK
jgi:stringent starvation protein B